MIFRQVPYPFRATSLSLGGRSQGLDEGSMQTCEV